MAWGRRKGSGGGVAWLALIVALLALYVAWSAYRRTGGDIDQLAPMGSAETQAPAEDPIEEPAGDWRDDLARARERLLARRSDVEEERDLEQVRRDVADIRANLERAYRGAGDQARESWRSLDAEMEELEAQLQEGSSRAKETLDSLLERMRG